ncbi:MAG: glycosyltransferase family 4 protein [Clostridiales bacterium]|nr:glycosyltransferase family 4 protein [Clostridiales bacterium]
MRVLHILTDQMLGGAGRCVLSLARWARVKNGLDIKNGLDVAVIVPEGSDLVQEFEKLGVQTIQAQNIKNESFSLKAVPGLARMIKESKADIVHTHASLSGRMAARLAGKKVVVTRHCAYEISKARFPKSLASSIANTLLADAYIAVSPAVVNDLIAIGAPKNRINVIFNGVEESLRTSPGEREKARRELGLSKEDFVAAIIARLVDVKGHDTVIQAARELPDVKFLIAGAGPMEEELKRLSSGLENVLFLGFVKDIGRIENITDLQINASYGTEATSMSLISGFSLGVPAVASDFGGNPHVVRDGENGIIFKQRDSKALADAIRLLKKDELRAKMGSRAREIYLEKFTLEAMGKATHELYQKIANNA